MAVFAPDNARCQVSETASATGTQGAFSAADPSVLPQSGYMTAEWVKRHYSISNSTLYKWIADKRFVAPVRIGPRAVRWRAEDLRAYEASLTEGGR